MLPLRSRWIATETAPPQLLDARSGLHGIHLLKVTGSAFTRFVRDANTTLPDRGDRPLFIHMDVSWQYADPADLLASDYARYVPAEQVRDLLNATFSEFVSESIQHLVHEIGTRLLTRFPQLAEISFEAQNRTPDPMAVSETDEQNQSLQRRLPRLRPHPPGNAPQPG